MVGTMARAETEAGRKWQEDTHGTKLDLVLFNIPHISIFFYLFQFFFNLKKWQEDTHGSKLDLVLLNIPHISILFTFLAALVALHFTSPPSVSH